MRPNRPTARSPVAGTVELVKPYTPSGRYQTNHAYLDRLTVPSDSTVWRSQRHHGQKLELGADDNGEA